jgi:hypothetical protein
MTMARCERWVLVCGMTETQVTHLESKLDRMLDLLQKETAARDKELAGSDAISSLAKQVEMLERIVGPTDLDYGRREFERLEKELQSLPWSLAIQSQHNYKHYLLLKERMSALRAMMQARLSPDG